MTKEETTEVREFEGIEVTYPPEDICTYPEYKGKPYFGIRYRENGESIVGYGTYNPQVLSRYLKDYFMSTTKNDCSEQNGCISCSLDDGDDCCRKLYEESMQDLTTKNDIRDNRVKNELKTN